MVQCVQLTTKFSKATKKLLDLFVYFPAVNIFTYPYNHNHS